MDQVVLFALATATVSFTIAETKAFAPFRTWARGHVRWFGELVSCGYCLGLWVALALVAIYRPRAFYAWWPLDYLLTALSIGGLAAFVWLSLCALSAAADK